MGIEVDITAGRDLAAVRRALRELGDKGLGKQLSRGLSRAVLPLRQQIRAEAISKMPSGYGPVLSKSLRFRQSTRASRREGQVIERVYGDGQRERRDVVRIDQGILRHPVFGRSRPLKRHALWRATSKRNPWVAQPVEKGFATGTAERMQSEIGDAMRAVLDEVADKIRRA